MAAHLDFDGIESMNVQDYQGIRPNLKTGDLFFASGRYIVSKLIQKFTDSPWSHVAIVVRLVDLDRVLLLESVEDTGVRIVPLSKYLDDYDSDGKPYNGWLALARPKNVDLDIMKELAQFGADELGRPYDKDELATIASRIALGIGRKGKKDRTYICSELVQACFANANYYFPGDDRGFISPENIWVDSRVDSMCRIQ
jgi:hypothetical protein